MNKFINQIEPVVSTVGGFPVLYYGELPKDRCVYISSSSSMDSETEKYLYASSLEAALMGYEVIYIPTLKKDDPIKNGVFDGKGTLHAIIPFGLYRSNKRDISQIIIHGGSVISESLEDSFSLERLERAKLIASAFADSIVVGERLWLKRIGEYIEQSLDNGKDVAVLKSVLGSHYLNDLVLNGAPAITTFSDFIINPPLFIYPHENGRYSQKGFCFDIISYGDM